MSIKEKIINSIIEVEGGYVNDPKDSGGETKYGITKAVAFAYGYTGNMRDLPRDLAFEIYAKKYWDRLSLSLVEALSPALAEELADTAINMGTSTAAKFLQRSLNVLNMQGKQYNDLAVDGDLGRNTLSALRAYFKHRGIEGETVLLRMLNSLQGAKYVSLAERREKDEAFVFGWFQNRIKFP